MFNDKKILFYGPGVKAEEPDVNSYDFVIITNNQVSFFFNEHKVETKVLLWVNGYFGKHGLDNVRPYANFIFGSISGKKTCDRLAEMGVRQKLHIKRVKGFKKIPLGLTKILNFLNDYNFKQIDIVGIDFFEGERLYEHNDYPLPGTAHETKEKEIQSIEDGHGIAENKAYLKRFMEERKNVRLL